MLLGHDLHLPHHQGSHPTWKTWNFVIYFSRTGRCMEFAQKVGNTWNFNSNLKKKQKFGNSVFCDSLSRCHFWPKSLIYIFVVSTLSTQTQIISQSDHCFYLEIIWKIHGFFCHQRSGNPVPVSSKTKTFSLKQSTLTQTDHYHSWNTLLW